MMIRRLLASVAAVQVAHQRRRVPHFAARGLQILRPANPFGWQQITNR